MIRVSTAAVLASLALVLALPAGSQATLTEVGVIPPTTNPETVPSCPGSPCLAVSRTTGFQVKVGTTHNQQTAPRAGTVALALGLSLSFALVGIFIATLGASLELDHRRIAAAALERLRGKLAYRPVVFEVLPETFTLSTLQQVVEALAGQGLHKQNFRRLVATSNLVEPTGESDVRTGGRPAELYRFRREVLRERPAPGLGLRRLGGP